MGQFKEMKNHEGRINPDRSWVLQNKERLMGQIGNTTESNSHFSINSFWQGIQVFIPGRVVYSVVRPLAVFLLVFTIAASGWITTVGATQNQLPGDFAYGVKVAVSKVTKDDIDVASDIAKDVTKVAKKKEKNTSKNVAVGVEYLKKSLDDANEDVKNTLESKPGETVEKAKKMSEAVKEINKELVDTKKEMSEAAKVDEEANLVSDELEVVKNLASDSAMEAVENVLQKKLDGSLEASDEDVKTMLSDQIQIALGDTNQLAAEVEGVVSASSSTTAVVSSTLSVIVSSTVKISTSTTDVVNIKGAIEETTKKVVQTGEDVKKSLEKAQELMNNNQLLEALEKVKEVNQATNEAQNSFEEVKKQVKQVAEISQQIIKDGILDDLKVQEAVMTTNTTEAVSSSVEEDLR